MHSPLTHPKYRADIDGLRAVAVLGVVAYHAAPSRFGGGFVGVDIFFVISGYLITTIIVENLARGSFRFALFYRRRIRRIFPALVLVLAVSLAAGWFLLTQGEYDQLGQHAAAGALFVANFLSWMQSGYFDKAAATKPLLHLWSLGIEEQFYIAWPLLLWAIWNRKIDWKILTALIVACSFALNMVLSQSDPVASFYSPLTRIWELLAGALLARRTAQTGTDVSGWEARGTLASAAGAGLIAASLILIDARRHYPSAWALLPTGGALLIIAAGSRAWFNRKVLAHPVLVWFGLISYPLYLWHWPLLSFARIVEGQALSQAARAIAVAAAIVLAWLTWRFVERPIRLGESGGRKAALLVAAMALVGGAGFAIHEDGGIAGRFDMRQAAELSAYDYFNGATEEAFWKNTCFNLHEPASSFARNGCDRVAFPGRPRIFLIGDSHSAYLSQGLRPYLMRRKLNLMQFSAGWCVPLSLKDDRRRCDDINRTVLERIAAEKPELVIVFANYLAYQAEPNNGETVPFDAFVRQRTEILRKAGAGRIIVIGQIPTWTNSLPSTLLRRFALRGRAIPDRTFDGVDPVSLDWDARLRRQHYPAGVAYLSLKDFLCNQAGCLTRTGPDLKSDLMVWDYGHLTRAGADFITQNLLSKRIP